LAEVRDNLVARIAEAEREGWLGEVEGLRIRLTGANDKLAQIDRRTRTVDLPVPTIGNAPTARPSGPGEKVRPRTPTTSRTAQDGSQGSVS
jgi:hypothetical protein